MKILAIDFGTKRVGLALSDETATFAHRLDPIKNYKNVNELIDKLANLVEKEGVNTTLVGLPLGIGEKDTLMSKKIELFIQRLRSIIKSKVETVNETYTTRVAYSNLGKRIKNESVDSESARIMLQEYLDFQKEKLN